MIQPDPIQLVPPEVTFTKALTLTRPQFSISLVAADTKAALLIVPVAFAQVVRQPFQFAVPDAAAAGAAIAKTKRTEAERRARPFPMALRGFDASLVSMVATSGWCCLSKLRQPKQLVNLCPQADRRRLPGWRRIL